MPTLELSIHCLCHVVPNPDTDIVHVLMPATHRHHRHVVRALHDRLKAPKGRSLDGWVLQLGDPGRPSADRRLEPEERENGAQLFSLEPITGPLPRVLIEQDDHPKIAARIDLLAGRLISLHAEANWKIREEFFPLSYRAVWRIEDFTEDQWVWRRTLQHPPHDDDEPPFEFSDIAGRDETVSLDIYHVTEDALPPKQFGTLDPDEVAEHFKAFYELYDHTADPDDLPTDPEFVDDPETRVGRLVQAARDDGDPIAVQRLARIAETSVRAAGTRRSEFFHALRDDVDSKFFDDPETRVGRLVQAARDDGDPMAVERLARIAVTSVRAAIAEREQFFRALRDDVDSANCPKTTGTVQGGRG